MKSRFQLRFILCAVMGFICVLSRFNVECSGMEVVGHGIINTTFGPVQGKSLRLGTDKEVVQFLSVPYANASRFERPEPPTPWNYTRQATTFGNYCPQTTSNQDAISEYCLNVNVFVPNTTVFRNQSASYPVMVWLNGRSLDRGTSAGSTDASVMATEGELVVITVNYRLGAFGFLSTGDEGLKGNLGMLDVIEALKWVRNNSAGFGGDAGNITLAGWSEGARLVSMVMLSPQASVLYDRVIIMSGVAGGLFSYLTPEEARERAEYYGAHLRCPYPSPDFLNCLKRKTVKEMVDTQDKMLPSAFLPQWAPVIDGHLIPDVPNKLIAQGRYNSTSVLMGIASSDGSVFLNDIPGVNKGVNVTKGLFRSAFNSTVHQKTWMRHQDEKVPNMIVYQYTDWTDPDNENKTRSQYLDLLTDAVFRAPAIQAANEFVKNGVHLHFYQTEYREDRDQSGKLFPDWMGVPHGDELRYLFPNPNVTVISQQTKSLMDFWINYVKSGDPNIKGQQVWLRYTLKEGNYLAIRSFPRQMTKLRVEQMTFWNEFLPANGVRKEIPTPNPPPEKDMDSVMVALIVISCLFGVLLIILLVLVVIMMRGGLGSSDKRQPVPPPVQTYSVQSQKPILYSHEKNLPKYEEKSYPRYPMDEKNYPRYPDEDKKYPRYPNGDKNYPRYPDNEKNYPRYPDNTDSYPPYNPYDNDASFSDYNGDGRGYSNAEFDRSDKFMDSDML